MFYSCFRLPNRSVLFCSDFTVSFHFLTQLAVISADFAEDRIWMSPLSGGGVWLYTAVEKRWCRASGCSGRWSRLRNGVCLESVSVSLITVQWYDEAQRQRPGEHWKCGLYAQSVALPNLCVPSNLLINARLCQKLPGVICGKEPHSSGYSLQTNYIK